MAKKIKKGKVVMWVDGSGAEVPEKYVDPVLKERDKFVSRQVAKARQMRMLLTNFKRAVEALERRLLDMEKLGELIDKVTEEAENG